MFKEIGKFCAPLAPLGERGGGEGVKSVSDPRRKRGGGKI
jgi:hypothetical protein